VLEVGNEAACGSQMVSISVTGSVSALFGAGCMVAERVNSSQKLLGVGEKGLYSSYMILVLKGEEFRREVVTYR
jgi:hypothetical protein